jgi:hypothetical protein
MRIFNLKFFKQIFQNTIRKQKNESFGNQI